MTADTYQVPALKDFSPEALERSVVELTDALEAESRSVKNESDYKIFRDRWLARKNGILTQVNDLWLKAAPSEHKREVGRRVNELKASVEARVDATETCLRSSSASAQLEAERIDITLPGVPRKLGAEHPVIKTMNQVVGVFKAMGYSVEEGPEVETDYYNFESMNFPPNHPARDTQDTLVIAGQQQKPLRERLLLRTHTSPVQMRTMEKQPPPVRVVVPGKVHRNDALDATHSPIFHQVEGLAVDTNITFCDLKGTLDHAMKMLFGSSVKTRFYPSFFPFTEPSADMQVSCPFCGMQGCRICKHSGWIEILGCGMVDPEVFKFAALKQPGYDTQKISGFAFGMGVERIALLTYDIDEIGLFYQGDIRFLEQFA